jgi:predicted esterase
VTAVHHIATEVHGRYLVDAPPGDGPFPVLVGFHGYAELAATMLEQLARVRADRPWIVVSVQALNRFYTRANEVVANWMTREDREFAIADNVAYVAAVVAEVRAEYACTHVVVYAGFSQGVAMAYRATAFAHLAAAIPHAAGGIMLAGDIPPDVIPQAQRLPPLLIGRGEKDSWYTAEKAAADLAALASYGVAPALHVFAEGHEWTPSFAKAAGNFLDRVAATNPDSSDLV